MAPPDSIPNSEVKRNSADGSVGSPHVRVGHRQASPSNKPRRLRGLFTSEIYSNQELIPIFAFKVLEMYFLWINKSSNHKHNA